MSERSDPEAGTSLASRTTPVLPIGKDGGRVAAARAREAEPTETATAAAEEQHPATGPQARPAERPAREPGVRASTSGSGSSEIRFPPGTMLANRYRIVHMVGRGGMGEVYSADDLELGQRVALKLLPEKWEDDSARLERLRNEVRLARSITHANVCRVYDIGEAEGRRFLSMEYIIGEDLDALQRRIGRVPTDKAVDIGVQLCRGLAAIHERGILHRDLKPANVLLDADGRVRIADFGLASLVDEPAEPGLLRGTPAYMAPEQLGAQEVSIQSDLYALGLILRKLLTGRPAAEAKTPLQLYAMRSEAAPPPPSTLVSGIPPAVDAIITRCLAPAPRQRPGSAREVEAALLGLMPGQTAALVIAVAGAGLDREALVAQLGDDAAARVLQAHAQAQGELCREHAGTRVRDAGEPLVAFAHPGDAVRYALAVQRAVQSLARREGATLAAGVGVHLGLRPRAVPEPPAGSRAEVSLDPATRDLAERLSKLARPGQILLTRSVFDLARQDTLSENDELLWLAHGSYELAGLAEPVELCEVGVKGVAPLAPPAESELARRRRVQDVVTGWRPAPGMELPALHARPHWRMEKKLGEGGFGEVWLGKHARTGERRVFKFCYDAEKLRALQREITLFRLLKETLGDRDDIVRILDWSFDEAPYFVESAYTAGGDLVEWAAAQGGLPAIALADRLAIVAQVATALAAAHSVGVLHKDVKPANVLMAGGASSRARAQLGDFGVGAVTEKERLADAGITALGLTVDARTSMAAALQGTRLYMAPELLEGKPATMQADIYALGVMLYQVVAGDFTRALAPGWERDVEDELLRADIAAAVDGDPGRRLGSAAQLAERLATLDERRRELAAIRQELAERERARAEAERVRAELGRVRRRRRFVVVTAGVLLLFAGVVTVQSLRIAREARAAEAAANAAAVAGATAQQVSDFLIALFEEADPHAAQGRDVSAREILDRGLARIAELDEQPEVQATLTHVMGVVYFQIGRYQQSASLLEDAVEKRRQLYGDRHPALAESLHALARTLERRQMYAPAEQTVREALELRRALLGSEHLDTAETMEVLADVLVGSSRKRDAEPLYREVLAIRRKHLGAEHRLVAQSLSRMGSLRFLMRDHREAADWYRQALDMYTRLPGDHGPDIALAKYYLGLAFSAQQDVAAAEPLLRESIEANRRLLGEDHPWVGVAMSELAFLYQRTGQYDRAEPLRREALELYRQSSGDASPAYAITLGHLASIVRIRGDCREADALSRQAVSIFQKTLPADHVYIADSLNDRGLLLESWGDFAAAERRYRESLDVYERLPSEDEPYASVVMANLAHIYVITGRLAQADTLLGRAAEALRHSSSTDGWHMEHVNSVRGAYLARTGDHASAERLLRSAHAWLKTHHGAHRHYTQRALERIIAFLETQGRSDEAKTHRASLDRARCTSSP